MRLALFAVFWLASLAAARTDFSLWKDSVRVQFNTTASGAATQAPLKNFPLLIRLQAPQFNLANFAKGGADVRFTDPDGTELPCHIARWDTGFYRNAEIWVSVPEVAANSAADYVVMWWGNKAAPAAIGQTAIRQGPGEVLLGGDIPMGGRSVFDPEYGFVGAWHLDEEAALKDSKALYRDASLAGNHGLDSVAGLSGAGVVGRAIQFDPLTGDYIPIKHTATQALTGPISFAAWIKGNKWSGTGVGANVSQVNPILRKGDANNNPYQFCVSRGKLMLSLDSNDVGGPMSTAELALGKWLHVAGVWDGSKVQLYIDGKLDVDAVPAKVPALGKADTRPLNLGGRAANFTDVNTLDLFDGALDEIHMSRAARSKDWIRLSYENQKVGSAILTYTRIAPKDTAKEDYTKWKYKKKITFNTTATGANVPKGVEKFPVLVRLTSAQAPFSQFATLGRDLRFADQDGNRLPISIVTWDSSKGAAEVWTRVPKIDGNSKSGYMTAYWGKADAPTVNLGSSVFDTADGWAGVWHLQNGAAGRGAAKVYKDATGFYNDGEDLAAAEPEAALIGKGQRFGPEASDCVRIPSAPSLQPTSEISFSAWIKAESFDSSKTGNVNVILRKGDASPNTYLYALRNGNPTASLSDGEDGAPNLIPPLQAKTWYHLAAAWGKEGVMRYYVNGFESGIINYPRPTGIGKDARPLYIGGRDAVGDDKGDQFQGLLDEVQLSRVERPAEFIRMAYENQRPDSKLLEWEGASPDTARPDTTVVKTPAETSDTVLAAGQTHVYGKIYLIANPLEGDSPVRVRFLPPADRTAKGIADARETILLEPAQTGKAFPKVVLEANANLAGGVGLFRSVASPNGGTDLISYGKGIGSWTLTAAGEYFLGRDTVAPTVLYLNEGIGEGDSSWITVLPRDNVSNLSLVASHSRGTAEADIAASAFQSDTPLRLAFPPKEDVAPELVHVRVEDGAHAAGFPDLNGSWYQLQRRVRASKAPVAVKGGMAWTFAGIPLRLDRSVTLAEASGGSALYGAVWRNDASTARKGDWRLLEGKDTLPTGTGIWLASPAALATLFLGNGNSAGMGGENHYHLDLVKGWNQVTCPGLEELPWPIASADLAAQDLSPFKSLLALNPSGGGYIGSDTLKPWQGYFVYAKENAIVDLSAAGAAHKRAAQGPALHAILEAAPGAWSQGAVSRLRLGAAAYARDGIGMEDEPAPPAAGSGGALALARGAAGWRTDMVGWRGPGEYLWKLAWTTGSGTRPAMARMRIAGMSLPEGMRLWAASPLRKVAEPVAAGSELEVLGDAADTVYLWAAPAGQPFPYGAAFAPRPAARSVAWIRDGAGGRLRIALPEAAGVRAECRDLAGRRLGLVERAALAPGYYEFGLGASRAAGLRIVTVAFRGGAGPARHVLKIAGP